MQQVLAKNPSRILRRAIAVEECLTQLEQKKLRVLDVTITPDKAVIELDYLPACGQLHARECGSLRNQKGLFTIMRVVILGVFVQYLRPFNYYVVKPPRLH